MRISDWSSDVCSSDLSRSRFQEVPQGDQPCCARYSWRRWGACDVAMTLDGNAAQVWRGEAWAGPCGLHADTQERKSVGLGKSVSVSVDPCGRRIIKKKKKRQTRHNRSNKRKKK